MAVLSVDIGGTNVRAGVFETPASIVSRWSVPVRDFGWPLPACDLARYLRDRVRELGDRVLVRAAGISVAAVVDRHRGSIKVGENLGWRDVPLEEIIAEELAMPVVIDVDAFCGAEAEARVGSGRDLDNFVFVAIGTGMGHGLVLERKVWRGPRGAANVFGHLKVTPGGEPCYCGGRGCLCQYASGPGIARVAALARGGPTRPLRGEDVVQAYRRGESWAQEALLEAHRHLALSVSTVFNLLDINGAVFGGGAVSDVFPDLWELRRFLEALVYPQIRPLVLRQSALRQDATLVGAALQAFDLLHEKGQSQ